MVMVLADPSHDSFDETDLIERREALWETLEERVTTVAGARNAADAELCALFAEVLDVDGWKMDGIRSENHWLTWQFGLTPSRATQMLRIARRWHALPHASQRFLDGQLTFEQMSIIARRCPAGYDNDVATFAVSATLRQLETSLRDYHFDADTNPDAGPDEPAPTNRVTRGFDDQGRYRLNADLDATTGAMIDASIDHALDRLRTTAADGANTHDPDGETGLGTATLSDALLDIFNRSIAADPSTNRRRRYDPVLHIDIDRLIERGADNLTGNLHLGPTLTERVTALMLCDSTPSIVAELGGVPLAKGRTTEKIPHALRQLIHQRDGGCRICGATRNLHVHHITHWANGGPTDPDNLVTLCHRHHVLVHQGAIDVQGDPTQPHDHGALQITDQHGRTFAPPNWHHPPDNDKADGDAEDKPVRYQHPLGEAFDRNWLHFNPNNGDGDPPMANAPPNQN